MTHVEDPRETGSLGRRRILLVAGAIVFIFVYFPNLYPGYLSVNEMSRVFLTKSIVEEGTFIIDSQVDLLKGRLFSDLAEYDGHYYTDKAIGVSLLGVPTYFVARLIAGKDIHPIYAALICRWVAITIPALLFLVYLIRQWKPSREFDLLLLLGLFLGTSFLPFAMTFAGHAPMAMLIFVVFWRLIVRPPIEPGPGWHALNGALCGLVVMVDYTAAAFALAAAGVQLWRYRTPRALLPFGAPALVFLISILTYNAICFAGPLDIAYNHMAQADDRVFRGVGFFGIQLPRLEALWGLTFGTMRGLFPHTPVLLLLFPAAVRLQRSGSWRFAHSFAAGVLLFYFYLNTSLGDWQGGWSLGPRYLVPIYPFWFWLVLEGYRRESPRVRSYYGVFAVAAVVWSVLLHLTSIATWSLPSHSPVFTFPALEVCWQLLTHEIVSFNIGSMIGIRGWWSLIPPAIVILAALAACLGRRLHVVVPAALTALALFIALNMMLARSLSEEEHRRIRELPSRMGYSSAESP